MKNLDSEQSQMPCPDLPHMIQYMATHVFGGWDCCPFLSPSCNSRCLKHSQIFNIGFRILIHRLLLILQLISTLIFLILAPLLCATLLSFRLLPFLNPLLMMMIHPQCSKQMNHFLHHPMTQIQKAMSPFVSSYFSATLIKD